MFIKKPNRKRVKNKKQNYTLRLMKLNIISFCFFFSLILFRAPDLLTKPQFHDYYFSLLLCAPGLSTHPRFTLCDLPRKNKTIQANISKIMRKTKPRLADKNK